MFADSRAMTEQSDRRSLWIAKNILPHERNIRMWLSRRRVHDCDIDDMIQEMYAKIGSLKSPEKICSPKSYAYRVAYSVLLDHLRKSHLASVTSLQPLEELEIASLAASPEDEVAYRDELRQVANIIKTLPPRTREVFRLRRMEGLSQRETAERLSVSEKAVEKHMTQVAYVLSQQYGTKKKVEIHRLESALAGEDQET